jgi:archaetidylinositol phosphate synthase
VNVVSNNLKKIFEKVAVSAVPTLTRMGITPNILTILGVMASIAAGLCYLKWDVDQILLIIGGVLVLVSGLLDAFDGVLARATNRVSVFGGFFDSVSDRYSDAIVLAAIIVSDLCDPLWGMAALIGSMMVSYSRARAESEGIKMASVGFAERAERMLIIAIVSIISYYKLDVMNWGIALLAILANYTVYQRAKYFNNEILKG